MAGKVQNYSFLENGKGVWLSCTLLKGLKGPEKIQKIHFCGLNYVENAFNVSNRPKGTMPSHWITLETLIQLARKS